jgi:1-acyl-sn-glycerol-3-phosphate acyltransferase
MVGFLIFSIPTLIKMKKLNPRMNVMKRDKILHQVPKQWSKNILKLAGAKVSVEGQHFLPDGPVVLMCNHESDFDIPVLLGYIDKPFGFISKVEVKNIPILAQWMEVLHCVFINRRNSNEAVKSLRNSTKILRKGHSLLIFPEGTRSKGGPMGPFKIGGFRLAVEAKVPIIPISIHGTADLFEKNHRLIRPASIKVVIGEQIVSHLQPDVDLRILAEEVRMVIIKQINNKRIAS